jgi:RimJ/RimL family protein N-acetyltransferase
VDPRPFPPRELQPGDGPPLTVRTLGLDDAEAWAAHVREDLARLSVHLGWPARTASPEGARGFLGPYARREDGRELLLGAFDDDAGGRLVAGALLMRHDPEHGAVELGCWAVAAAEGRGIVRRLCLLALEHAHEALGAHRVLWEAAADNHRSRALAQRLGFRFEGRLREAVLHDGRRLDIDLLSLVGPELPRALAGSAQPAGAR